MNSSDSESEPGLFERLEQEIHAWPIQEGIRSTDLTLLEEPLRGVLNTTVREGSLTLQEFAEGLGLTLDHTEAVVDLLLEHGFLRSSETTEQGETEYRVRYARAGRKTGDLWQRIGMLEDNPVTLTFEPDPAKVDLVKPRKPPRVPPPDKS